MRQSDSADPKSPDLLGQLSSRYRRALISFFIRRKQSPPEAEDLTQDVLLRAVRAADREHLRSPDSYIFKIASNLLRDGKRRAGRDGIVSLIPIDTALSGELERQLVEDLDPERVLLSRDNLNDALQALAELGERTRDIFILFRLEGMKQKDIARLFGIGQSTVEKHVTKAVLHLMARCGGPEDTRTPHGRE